MIVLPGTLKHLQPLDLDGLHFYSEYKDHSDFIFQQVTLSFIMSPTVARKDELVFLYFAEVYIT